MTVYQYAISTTATGLNYLFDLGVVAPKQAYQPASEYVELGNGDVQARGYSVIEWYWEYLSDAETTALRVFCANGSGEVHVRSLDEDLVWRTWRARMIWPTDAPDIDSDFRMKVAIRFNILELLS